MDCIFCKIIDGDIPSYTVYENNNVKVFLDINPISEGHLMVVPKKHFENLFDIDLETLHEVNKVAKDMITILKDKLSCQGITIVQNNAYGQDIKHYHMHLIPRYEDDQLKFDGKNIRKRAIEEVFENLKA